jgi:glycosyltransferase involved in cell wall biosynthesis
MVECFWQQGSSGRHGGTDSNENGGRVLGRVLHVVNGEHFAGAERVQDLLGGALPWFGYETGIACVKPGQFLEARKNRHVPVWECRMHCRLDLRPVRFLVRLIREHRYDLIHAHTPRALLVASAAAALARVPLVYHIHSPAAADTTSRLRNMVNALFERTSLATADHLIAVSRSLRERYLRLGFARDRITVVSNGVPCGTRFPIRPFSPGEPVVFGIAALFRPRKGLEILLRSTADLLAAGYRLRLRAVGQFETAEYERQIKTLATKLAINDAIDWTGFSSSIEGELAQIDCLVLPSLFGEGLPMVVLEAMACGRPVIATDVEGTPEAIHHGENGLLAKPNDSVSLALEMKRVVDGVVNLQPLAQRAAEDQRRRFSVCSMTRGVAEVYDRVLGITDATTSRDCRKMPCIVSACVPRDALETGNTLPIDGFMPTGELPV